MSFICMTNRKPLIQVEFCQRFSFRLVFTGGGGAGRGACGRAAVQCLHIQRKFGLDICARTFQHLPKEHV